MNLPQSKHLAQRLCELFPGQLKPAEKALAVSQFQAFAFELVDRLIVDRWQAFKRDPSSRLDLAEMLAACRASIEQAEADRKSGAGGSWCATQRRHNKHLRGEKSDHALILRVYGGFWDRCDKSDGYRAMLRRQCVGLLVGEGGLTAEAAEADADLVLTDVPTLRARLSDLRGELPAFSGAH